MESARINYCGRNDEYVRGKKVVKVKQTREFFAKLSSKLINSLCIHYYTYTHAFTPSVVKKSFHANATGET